MNVQYVLTKLQEPSTWRGLIAILTLVGVHFAPDQTNAIITAGVALVSAVEIFRTEPVVVKPADKPVDVPVVVPPVEKPADPVK
jgi:hypothetical protein